MSETVHESNPESQSPHTEQPAGRSKGPFTAPRPTPPPPAEEHHSDDVLLDTECEVIAIGHARFYLRYADWLPPLTTDELNGLTASIQEHGIQQPVVVYRLINNHFDVIDGLHRLKVAQALGFDLAQIPLNILDQATSVMEQKALAWSLNADRRHLTKEQRRARALELRKQGLSYRAIGEELGVSQMTARSDVQEATVKDFTVQLPERVVSKDGKSRPATAPPPSENEVQIARGFIVDALRKKYSPLARGQLYRDASRIAGASGIKRKAFDAALDAMLEAGSVREHINAHGRREYHFAYVVERIEQRTAASEAERAVEDALGNSDDTRPPDQESPTIVDELDATFDHSKIRLSGRTDDGAWHRAVEIARRLIAAGVWNGRDRIEFDAYALHDRLFGVKRIETSDLVEGDDYRFVAVPAKGDEEPAGMSVYEYNRAAETVWQASAWRADLEARIESRLAANKPEEAEYAYLRFAAAARAIVNYLPGIRAGQEVDWDAIDENQRAQARELLDELAAVATDLPTLLSEISQKLGAA